jgi:membrane-bound lytic murein transglycosylase D
MSGMFSQAKVRQFSSYFFLLSFCFSFLGGEHAFAASARTVPWSEMEQVLENSIDEAQYSSIKNLYHAKISQSTYDFVLADSENRIGKAFKLPSVLKDPVRFWLKIYTEYSTKEVLIFDTNHLEVVYEVLDLKPIFEASKNQAEYERRSAKFVRNALGRYRSAFSNLIAGRRSRYSGREELIILSQAKRMKHRHPWKEMSLNLKAIRGQRNSMVNGLLAAESFFPKMEVIFSMMGIPKEVVRLCLVESTFDVMANSKAGALGLWQFIPQSGKHYLLIDLKRKIDERLSPFKSTVAAGKLLLWNYHYLGNWPLAIISYNHGLKNLPRMVGKQYSFEKLSYLFNSCKNKPELGWASRNYYSEFLAAVYAEKYKHLFYGDTPTNNIRPVRFERLTQRKTALAVAMELGVPLGAFRQANADIRDLHQLLPKGFWIAIPGDSDNIHGLLDHSVRPTKRKKI